MILDQPVQVVQVRGKFQLWRIEKKRNQRSTRVKMARVFDAIASCGMPHE